MGRSAAEIEELKKQQRLQNAQTLEVLKQHPDWKQAISLFSIINQTLAQLQGQLGIRIMPGDAEKIGALFVALSESGHKRQVDFPALLKTAHELTDHVGEAVAKKIGAAGA